MTSKSENGKSAKPIKCGQSTTGFRRTRKDEFMGLLNDGTFKAVRRDEVQEDTRVFGSCLIEDIKEADEMKRKSHVVLLRITEMRMRALYLLGPELFNASLNAFPSV